MLALAAAMGIGRFVYTPVLPAMATALGLSAGTAGAIASANFAGYLAGAVAALIRNLPGGRRAWFVGSIIASAATTAAMGLAATLPAFLLLRFAGGVASAFVLVLGTEAVLDALAQAGKPGRAWLHYGGVGLGIALSALLVAGLEAAGAAWQTLWLASGLAAAILLPLPARTLRWRPSASGTANAPFGRGMLAICLCQVLFGFGYVATATFIVAIVRASPTARTVEPLVWLVVGATAFPSILLWDRAAARLGPRPAYALAALLEAAGVLLGGVAPGGPLLLLAAALLGATFMGLTALGFTVARAYGPAGQQRRFAAITVGFGLGQVVGPIVAGALHDRTGTYLLPSALAAAALLAAALLMLQPGYRNNR